MQAVGQMLTRVGVETQVDVTPWAVYFTRCNSDQFSFFLGSFGVNTGETSNPIMQGNVTFDAKAGTGPVNFGRYSNPKLDKVMREAQPTLDPAKRNALLAQASDIVFGDRAILPLHFEGLMLGAKTGLAYTPRADGYTLAADVTRA